jgi:hypothetical protein
VTGAPLHKRSSAHATNQVDLSSTSIEVVQQGGSHGQGVGVLPTTSTATFTTTAFHSAHAQSLPHDLSGAAMSPSSTHVTLSPGAQPFRSLPAIPPHAASSQPLQSPSASTAAASLQPRPRSGPIRIKRSGSVAAGAVGAQQEGAAAATGSTVMASPGSVGILAEAGAGAAAGPAKPTFSFGSISMTVTAAAVIAPAGGSAPVKGGAKDAGSAFSFGGAPVGQPAATKETPKFDFGGSPGQPAGKKSEGKPALKFSFS